MPIFIDPTGQPTYGIGICGRCSKKYPLAELHPDPNTPGLLVCDYDLDLFDPYRLPARVTEDITLPFVRPDVPLDGQVSESTSVLFLIATEQVSIVITTENNVGLIASGVV